MPTSRVLCLLSVLLLSTSLPAQSGGEREITRRLDDLYGTFFTKDGVGAEVLVSRHGRVIYEKGFGMADLESGVPVGADTVFRIGSITKQFTSVAILQLAEQGKLDLTDEIQKYVPDFPRAARKITLENLLTHTSGIKNLTELPGLEIRQAPYTAAQLVDLFEALPLDFQPGERFQYSNSNYILLGMVVEQVSGQSYADYVASEIFAKLGMIDSYYDLPAKIIRHRAHGYDLDARFKPANTEYLNMTFPFSAGGLAMTVRDYWKWHQGLTSGRLLREETLRRAWSPARVNDRLSNYGYGWEMGKVFDSKTIQHGGRINGFNAKETWLPEEDVLIVIFSNGGFVNTDIINDQAAAIAADKPQFREIQPSATARRSYTGTYKFPGSDPTTIQVSEKGGRLFLKDSNAPTAWRMVFTAKDTFVCYEAYPNTHVFTKNEHGEVDALVIRNPGGDVKVIRAR